jgi:hypothetical protein
MPINGPEHGEGYAGDLVPRPDPTKLTTEAVDRMTVQLQRELQVIREVTGKDIESLRTTIDAKLEGAAAERVRMWDRADQLHEEFSRIIDQFRLDVDRRDHANRELIEQRLTDLDESRKVAVQDIRDSLHAEREFMMAQLEILGTRMSEKFLSVDEQFSASKIAVDAALSAAKEAVAEQNKSNAAAIKVSEGNTKEQLTSLGQVSSANFKAMEDKIADARDRLTQIESLTRGIEQAGEEGAARRSEKIQGHSQLNGLAIVLIASTSGVVAIISLILTVVLHKLGAICPLSLSVTRHTVVSGHSLVGA